jgi:hypothetical protein
VDRQEEAWSATDPAGTVERWATAWYNAMDMRVVMQGLPPSMEDGDEPDLGAEMLWIGSNDAQCLSRCSEQDGVDGRLILERDIGHWRRHGEDDVEIGDRQQLGPPVCQPLGAMPSAPGVTHRFTNLDAFMEEVANARIYAGFHYRTSTVVGHNMGKEIGSYVVKSIMQPLN